MLGAQCFTNTSSSFVMCRVRLISYETFSGVTWVKSLEKITRKSFVKGISSMFSSLLSQNMTKPIKLPVRPTMTQISLGICAV